MTKKNKAAFLKSQAEKRDTVRRMARLGQLPADSMECQILHDSWCDRLNLRGPCNCNPIITKPQRLLEPDKN